MDLMGKFETYQDRIRSSNAAFTERQAEMERLATEIRTVDDRW